MLDGIYKALTPAGIYITVSYGHLDIRQKFFTDNPDWKWTLTYEKITKPTISTSAGVTKAENSDHKNFHYIYILKKQVPKQEEIIPVEKKENEEEENQENSEEPSHHSDEEA